MNTKMLENKVLYKMFLTVVKHLPMILSIFQMIMLLLNYLGITAPLLIYFGGTSIIFLILLYIISFVFQYCYLYRIPLWYITIIGVMNLLRYFGFFPVDILVFYRLIALVSGFFMSAFVFYMYKNRNKPKVNPIKNFCERYCECC